MSLVSSKNLMQVIGVGWARTGTTSLMRNLENLGFGPCWHGWGFYKNRQQQVPWLRESFEKSLSGHEFDWDQLFGQHRSGADIVCFQFWKEICDYYPESKVILTVRDTEKWLYSMKNGPQRVCSPKTISKDKVLYSLNSRLDHSYGELFQLVDRINLHKFGLPGYATIDGNENLYKRAFEKHNQEIVDYFHSDEQLKQRFFVIDLKRKDQDRMQQELCQFLDVQIPGKCNVPYPKENTLEEYTTATQGLMRDALKQSLQAKLY